MSAAKSNFIQFNPCNFPYRGIKLHYNDWIIPKFAAHQKGRATLDHIINVPEIFIHFGKWKMNGGLVTY